MSRIGWREIVGRKMVSRLTPALQRAPRGRAHWKADAPMKQLEFLGRFHSEVQPPCEVKSVRGGTVRTPRVNTGVGLLGLRAFPDSLTPRGMTEVGLIHPIGRYLVRASILGWFVVGRILRSRR